MSDWKHPKEWPDEYANESARVRFRAIGTDQRAPRACPPTAVVANLRSDAARGLAGAEAKRRLEQYGPNQLKSAPETPWWKRLLEQFENFLVIILLVAIVISVIEWLLQDPRESALPYEAIVIPAIVVLNALLGYLPGGARRALGARADGAGGAGIDRDPRRRAPARRRRTRSCPATSC